ncbi:Uncharacterised protein [Legionella beliardensis]|uniref:Uncharacterized protein n=1 Tax=Legionella beliardensis TaxID=91822 RepID=A0A378I994_9GAMM|nr:hypothetical protein [Legionella beliardensis]STX28954.1 Uncharacterised protein [Legionella beliardensis]
MKVKQKGLISLAALVLSSATYATDLLATRHYEFEPNQGKVLTNPFLWQLTMTCTLSTQDEKSSLTAHMLKYTGIVNNHVLKEGEEVSLDIKDQDTLNISVDGSAQVEITNHGASVITADCEL